MDVVNVATEENLKAKLEELKKDEELIPLQIDERLKGQAIHRVHFDKAAKEYDEANNLLKKSKKDMNKATKEIAKTKREIRELKKELEQNIPKRKAYFNRQIKYLKKQEEETKQPKVTKTDKEKLLEEAAKKLGMDI